MPTPLLREAYARARPNRMHLHTLEIEHPGLAAPIRVIAPIEDDVALPLAFLGAVVTFQAIPFEVILPEDTVKQGPGEGQVAIDSVHPLLRQAVRDMEQTGQPATLIYREYEVSFSAGVPNFGAITGPTQVFDGLIVKSIDLSPTRATATLGYRDLSNLNVPRRTFDADLYKALHAS
jgi:hypothetical protein